MQLQAIAFMAAMMRLAAAQTLADAPSSPPVGEPAILPAAPVNLPAPTPVSVPPVPPVPEVLAVSPAPAVVLPALGTSGSTAPAPGLNGVFGNNVTLLVNDGTNCSVRGPDSRISGSGTFRGQGLFVGEGTINSTSPDGGQFILANSSFIGEGNCTGIGAFTSTSTSATLGGNGTITARGLFRFSQGLFNGSGTFSGVNLFFEKGVGTLVGNKGYLNGVGNATGSAVRCTGQGQALGHVSFIGKGEFTGRGYFYATAPSDEGSFVGTALITGNGQCGPGRAETIAYGSAVDPQFGVQDVIDDGDSVYQEIQTVEAELAS